LYLFNSFFGYCMSPFVFFHSFDLFTWVGVSKLMTGTVYIKKNKSLYAPEAAA
jgi:hypothetical protein